MSLKSILFIILLFASVQSISAPTPKVFAIVVGISRFSDTNIPNLQFADKDALAFAKAGGSFIECRDADLRGADLSNSYFFCGDFRGTNFKGANLKGAKLLYADLRGAIFDSADLSQALLTGAILDSVSFRNTVINQTDFFGAVSKKWTLTNTQIAGACRQYSAYMGEYLTYEVSLTEQRESNRFSSGYEFDDVLDKYYNTAILSSFADRNLPVCNCKVVDEKNQPWEVTWSAHRDLTLDKTYFSKANRKELFKTKVIAYRQLLSERLKVLYTLKGSGNDKKQWQVELAIAAKKIKPSSLPYLNTDLVLLLLAKNGLLPEEISWKNLSAQYSNVERGIRNKENANFSQFTMWEPLFPKDLLQYWNELSHDEIAQVYKQWVMDRARYAPDKIIVKVPVSLMGRGDPKPGYCSITLSTGFNYPEGIYPINTHNSGDKPSDEALKNRCYLMPVDRSLNAFYVFPKKMSAYDFAWPEDKLSGDMYLETELSLSKVERVKTSYSTAILVHVVPKKIRLLSAGKQIWEKKFE